MKKAYRFTPRVCDGRTSREQRGREAGRCTLSKCIAPVCLAADHIAPDTACVCLSHIAIWYVFWHLLFELLPLLAYCTCVLTTDLLVSVHYNVRIYDTRPRIVERALHHSLEMVPDELFCSAEDVCDASKHFMYVVLPRATVLSLVETTIIVRE